MKAQAQLQWMQCEGHCGDLFHQTGVSREWRARSSNALGAPGMRWASLVVSCLTLAAQNRTFDKEAAIGRQVAEQVRRSTTPVESQEVQAYVARLGARLTAQLPSPAFGYTFSVVSTDQSNLLHEPLAIPGRYIFVPSSLLLTANDEAEFAGMLAQAIAHEPVRIQNTAGTIPVIFVDSFIGNDALPATVMYQRRGMELQKDTIAALAMSRAGFDPAGLVRYIERVQPPDQPRSPFPPRDARIAALREAIRDIPPAVYAESDEFYSIQERVRPAPPKPRSTPSLLTK
jgi:beta-barrel assembly-enhancing protease